MPLGNSHELIKQICSTLFTAEERRLVKVKDQMIKANREFYPGKPHDGFMYQGQPYDPEGLGRGRRTRVPLHLDLIDQMDAYLADKDQVWTDRHQISQMLFVLLHPCESLQDIRDVLPNCIVDTLPDHIRSLSRTRDPAFTIQHDQRTYRQFKKVLPRIEFYATARLMY